MLNNQPNILFIVLDTQRRDHLSLYGHTQNTSPYLDEFSTRATTYHRAISPAQWTIPVHTSFFTGLYPSQHQVTQANHQLSGIHPTLAEILQVDGYHTVAFCNNVILGVLNHGLQRGFAEFYQYAGAAKNLPTSTQRNKLQQTLSEQFQRFARTVSNQFAHSDRLFEWAMNPALVSLWLNALNYKGSSEESIGDLIDYWHRHQLQQSNKPIFAFLNLMGTHLPYHPPTKYLNQVAPDIVNSPSAKHMMAKFNKSAIRWVSPTEPPLLADEQAILKSFYDAEILAQDEQLERLFDYLEQNHQLDNTLVIITADHGEGHGDHNFMGHGFVVHQELVQVPLIIYYPENYLVGQHIHENISTRRLFHTILDLANIELPQGETDSHSDLSLAHLSNALDTEMPIAEAYPPQTFVQTLKNKQPELIEQFQLTQIRRAIYDRDFKLQLIGTQADQLFDLSQDPYETTNILNQHPEIAENLLTNLHQFPSGNSQQITTHESLSPLVQENLRALGYIE